MDFLIYVFTQRTFKVQKNVLFYLGKKYNDNMF
jgi:hypothetical protein